MNDKPEHIEPTDRKWAKPGRPHDNAQTDREMIERIADIGRAAWDGRGLTADDVRDTMVEIFNLCPTRATSLAPGLHPDLKPLTGRLFTRADIDQWVTEADAPLSGWPEPAPEPGDE